MFSQIKYLVAQASGMPWFVDWINRNRLLVLTYHGIYDGPRKPDLIPNTFIHVNDLANQLKQIKRMYRVIDSEELQTSLETGSPLPTSAALVTFDDGYESFYRLAEPVLRSMGIRALVFIPTRYVVQHEPFWFDLAWLFLKLSTPDKLDWLMKDLELESDNLKPSVDPTLFLEKMKRMPSEKRDEIMEEIYNILVADFENYTSLLKLFYPMTGEQIEKLSNHGATFGGHTHSHTILSIIPDSLVENEVSINKKKLEMLLDRPCIFFAYPNGGEGDFNEKHKGLLRQAGYQAAFSLTQRRSYVHEDPMDISRIHVATEDTLNSLIFRCAGVSPILAKFRKLLNLAENGR